jgi:Ca2+/Na+ antiporter
MDVAVIGTLIPIVGIIAGVVMLIYLRRFQNQERMAMIEKGLDPSLFVSKSRDTSGALRASLLFIGAGIGLLLGYVLDRQFDMEEVGYFSMLLIAGGAGLGLAYIIEERKQRQRSS